MMKKTITGITITIFILFTALVLTACGAGTASKDIKESYTLSFIPAALSESTDPVNNPYRGFYKLLGVTLSEELPVETEQKFITQLNLADQDLILLQINLKNYKDSPLSQNALLQTESLLSAAKKEKRPIILRFLYDWDNKASETEPADADIVIKHMDQLKNIINKNKECLLTIQGCFVGDCGEMHSTTLSDPQHIKTLMQHFMDITDPDIYISVRTPALLRLVNDSRQPLSSSHAYSGSIASRIGLFNDGLTGSDTDLGTYQSKDYDEGPNIWNEWHRENEIEFQKNICAYVPNGGEVIASNEGLHLFENALPYIKTLRLSYLNSEYDPAVLSGWEGASVEEGIFAGMNGYNYIAARLGYRFVASKPKLSVNNNTAAVSFSIKNTGFAPAYKPIEASIVFRGNDNDYECPLDIDLRRIDANSTKDYTFELPLTNDIPVKGSLLLKLHDNSLDRVIYFANGRSFMTDDGKLILGTYKLT